MRTRVNFSKQVGPFFASWSNNEQKKTTDDKREERGVWEKE